MLVIIKKILIINIASMLNKLPGKVIMIINGLITTLKFTFVGPVISPLQLLMSKIFFLYKNK